MLTFSTQAPDLVYCGEAQHPTLGLLLLGMMADKNLCRLSFCTTPSAVQKTLKAWHREWPRTRFEVNPPFVTTNTPRFKSADLPDILLVGTPFQHRVWAALLDIPCGQTWTYGKLAAHIGNPKAARAVGTALGANPVPLLVPCHRVLASQGVGGYTGGLPLKRRLLAAEGAA